MQFSNRDLVSQSICISYGDVVQRYATGNNIYLLDGHGIVIDTLNITSSVTTSASYSVIATLANVALIADQTLSASIADTASYLSGFVHDNNTISTSSTGSNVIILQTPTASLRAAFFDYTIFSGSNMRVGNLFGGWDNGGNISYTETSNIDMGDTSQVSMSMIISASYVQLLTNANATLNWTIRAMGRYL